MGNPSGKRRLRGARACAALGALLAAAVWLGLGSLLAHPGHRHQLDHRSVLLAADTPVTALTVAAHPGKLAQLTEHVARLGGRVDYQHVPTDYAAVVLPSGQVDAFLGAAPWAAFALELSEPGLMGLARAVDFDPEAPAEQDRPPSPVRNAREGWPRPVGIEPALHPYDVRKDMDGEAFLARHPGNDGRGVVIAHVEAFPDYLAQELQTALDADGKPIPKFRDVINIAPMRLDLEPQGEVRGDYWSTRLSAPIPSRDGGIEWEGRRLGVPAEGSYRTAWLELRADLPALRRVWPVVRQAFHGRRDPEHAAPPDADVRLRTRLLWSDATRTLWIDTNQNGDFSDETGVREYAVSQQIGVLGRDDPTTVLRETLGYTVQKEGDYVSVNLGGLGQHETFVAAAAAARKGEHGLIEGVAPGAQLLMVNAHGSVHGFVRALVTAYEHPDVDILLIEGHGQITTDYELTRDGRSLVALMVDRLQQLHDKPSLFTANNTTGMSTIFDATVPERVLSVGAYQSADAVYAGFGVHARYQDDLHWVGSEGPAGNGLLKPDLLSPANPTSLFPGHISRSEVTRRDGVFDMDSRYMICGGTSCATPVAAGAAALLVSAAKREGLPVSGSALHRALRDSARRLQRFPLYQQGRGLIQIDAAWQRLQRLASEVPERIEVSAPVKTNMSRWLQQPNVGQGLFEREGWHAGQTSTRRIVLKRMDGPPQPVRYRLVWQGDTAAFQSASEVDLPLGQAVTLEVRVSVPKADTYSALLELHRAGLAGPAAVVPATIVVPHPFTAQNQYRVEHAFDLDRPGRMNLFYDVPEGAGVLRVQGQKARDGMSLFMHAPNNWLGGAFGVFRDGVVDVSLIDPMPGDWQVSLGDRTDSATHDWAISPGQVLPRSPVKLQASLLSLDVRREGGEIVVRNRGAAFDGRLRTRSLAAQRSDTLALAPVQALTRDLDVEPGTEQLVMELLPQAGTDAAWMNLYHCEAGQCTRHGGADLNGRLKRIAVDRPQSGRWKLVVTHFGDRPGQVQLKETHAHPRYGMLVSADTVQAREVGAQWRVPVHIWRRQAAPDGFRTALLLDVESQRPGQQPPSSVRLEAVPAE